MIKTTLLSALMLAAVSGAAQAQSQTALPTVYGSVIFGHGWEDMGDDAPYGIYSLSPADGQTITCVRQDARLQADGGGVYADGRYYMVDYTMYNYNGTLAFRVFDVDDGWRLLRERTLTSLTSIASDLAYDPVEDTIFGCFVDSEGKSYFFGTLDPITGVSRQIAPLSVEISAMAADRLGRLYGVDRYGTFYSIDKTTGALTEIAKTGKSNKYAQSATIDYRTGRFLWAMTPDYTNKSVELCEISLDDGAVTTLTEIPNRYELTGLYTESAYTADDAPARVSALTADYARGALTGQLRFTMPTATFGGASLTGAATYVLKVDSDEAVTASAAAGGAVAVDRTFDRGMHYVKVAAANAQGRSPFVMLDFWAGPDVAAVSHATTDTTSPDAVGISWTAPTAGTHGGYIDPAALTYEVYRLPGRVSVYTGPATQCTDKEVIALGYNAYRYAIVAKAAGEAGDTVYTDPVSIGQAASLPYRQTFDSRDAVSTMTVIDANSDDATWDFAGGSMYYGLSEACVDADDWLVTPPFQLSGDYVYRVSAELHADEDCIERIAFAAGLQPEAGALTEEVMPATDIAHADARTYASYFRPKGDGMYYVGAHVTSTYAHGGSLYLDDFAVSAAAPVKAPAAPTALTASAPDGKRVVSLTLTAPLTTIEGETLPSLDSMRVLRQSDGHVVARIAAPKPGLSCQVADTVSADGRQTYTAVAANAYGEGLAAETTVYVGYDEPSAVTGARVTAAGDDGSVTVTWQAPVTGKHGGVLDLSSMEYEVSNIGGSTSATKTVAETTLTDRLTLTEGKQSLAWYLVTPVNDQGVGETVSTDTVFVGKAYTLPYAESFARRSLDKGPWYAVNSTTAEWNISQFGTYADASDRDNGFISFQTLAEGARAVFVGPKVSLAGAVNPQLRFYAYDMKNSVHYLTVMLRTPDGQDHRLDRFRPNNAEGENIYGEWHRHDYSLSDYMQYDYVQPVFVGEGGTMSDLAAARPLYVDQISILSVPATDLAVTALTCDPDHVEAGSEVSFDVTLRNKASLPAEGYTVTLLRDGTPVATCGGESIPAEDDIILTLSDCPGGDAAETSRYEARVQIDGDADSTDNAATTVVTVLPGRPYVTGATASKTDGGTLLSWTRPEGIDRGTAAETVTEDFESYAAFTIRHFGQWTLHDGDGQATMGILDSKGYDYVQYDNVESPMAFQIMNPSQAGISTLYFPTHSGAQVAAAFSSGYTANDDWLISPEVDGAQTVTFWASSPDGSYYGTNETLEVLYSTGGTGVADFVKTGSTITVPQQWTKYTATLPEGARYFALRCTSQNQYVLFLDDITYRKAARDFSLTGYNVYRNGTLLTSSPVSATSYADPDGATTDDYEVSAVYNTGESRRTAVRWTDPTGISTVPTEDDAPTAVYDLSGRCVTGTAPGAVYIVRQGAKTRKVVTARR